LAVKLPRDTKLDPTKDVTISSSIHTSADTHIEFVTYGPKGDAMALQFTVLAANGTRLTRPLKLLASIVLRPWRFFSTLWPFGWSRRVVIFLVMQSLDNAISFRAKRRWFGGGVALTTEQDPEKPNPTYIEAGNRAAAWLANHTGGWPRAWC
jgi:cholesterol oxidase